MDPLSQQLHLERVERRHAPRRRDNALSLTLGIGVIASSVALALLASGPVTYALGAAILLTTLYAGFYQVDFQIGAISTAPLQVLFVPMWFALDPALLPLAVGIGQVVGQSLLDLRTRSRVRPWHTILALADSWYALGPAIVLTLAGHEVGAPAAWWLLGAALIAQYLFDAQGVRLRAWFTGASPSPTHHLLQVYVVDACLAPIGLLVALSATLGEWAALAVVPLTVLLAQFAKERDERIEHALELSSAYKGTAQLMGDVLEADDAYTGGEHTRGVVSMALALGRAVKLNAQQIQDLEFGALLHDIGKLRVPNEIINKPGKLNDEEWAIIKLHPGYGQEMLDRVGGGLSRAGIIVRAHHERWDGGGYPDGLVGEAIPIEARIITICDSYSAMTTNRSYRKGMSQEEALAELERCAGSQFDPALVAAAREVLTGFRPTLSVLPDPAATAQSSAAEAA